MTKVPSFQEVMSSPVTDDQARQFMADQEHERQREWNAKYRPEQNPMELFGNCR